MSILKIVFSLALFFVIGTSHAQNFNPTQPIQIVSGFAPGGAMSQVGQLLSSIFRDHGWASIVVSRPGNNTVIAGNYVAKSPPDGLTLWLAGGSSLSANIVWPPTGIEYNENSFIPISIMNQSAMGLVVNGSSPIKNYADLKAYVRANPDKFNIGFYNSNMANLFIEWARKEQLPKPTIVLYKGSGPMMVDVAGGNLDMAFDNFGWGAPMLPLVESGKLRVIATFDNSASKWVAKMEKQNPIEDISKIYPELKTSLWMGLVAPAGTPEYIINDIKKAIDRSINDQKYREQIEKMDSIGNSGAEMSQMIQRDIKLFRNISPAEK